MNLIKQFWQNFKSEPDVWFFYGFLLALPFSVRKVITFFPIRDQFNEYSGVYFYLSDIFLILTLFFWIIILCNKYRLLSIDKLFSIHKDKLLTKFYPQLSPGNILAYPSLIFVFWSFLSIFWSENQIIALFRSLKLLEFFVLAVYVAFRIVPSAYAKASADRRLPETKMFHARPSEECSTWNIRRRVEHFWAGGTIVRDTLKLIIFGGVVNSILAIWQFAIQHSIDLTFLKESIISPNIPGVAKISLFGEKMIRAYGLFPHPNILGGFLLLSIILTIYCRQMFHVEQTKEDRTFGSYTGWNIKLILLIQLIALILTFSKSAIIGLAIALTYLYVSQHGTSKLARIAIFTFFAISVAISLSPNLSPIQIQSLEERRMLLNIPRNTCNTLKCSTWNILAGSGVGQSVWSIRNLQLQDWQFQPVHNIFVLIWSELGIVGLILFVWMSWKMFQNIIVPRRTIMSIWNSNDIFTGIFLGFIFIMLFDHYFWDIQQGQIMLWLVFGLITGAGLTDKNKSDNISL